MRKKGYEKVNFYNDIDKNACEWTRELIRAGLIPDGVVSDTPIQEIKAHELTEFTQAHFFCGVAGWPLAFQLAGLNHDENADTGSCPCQPFSGTGKQMGFADPRHLWPAFRRIENRRQPTKIFGEQVASKLGREWLSRVLSDLEVMGYAGSAADLCSAGVGSPNIRQRLYWAGEHVGMANASGQRRGEARNPSIGQAQRIGGGCSVDGLAEPDGRQRHGITDGEERQRDGSSSGREQSDRESQSCGESSGLEHSSGNGREQRRTESDGGGIAGGRSSIRLGYADHARREGRLVRWDGGYERASGAPSLAGPAKLGMWSDCEIVWCRDSKWRRIEPGSFPLVNGVPSRVGPLLTELRKLGRSSITLARANRNIRLKGYGNAINPFVAAKFVSACRDRGTVVTRKAEVVEL